ncbi:hypothetical protein MNBD_ALPHA07-1257, partial [hydrothermal vent metagenome]
MKYRQRTFYTDQQALLSFSMVHLSEIIPLQFGHSGYEMLF